MESFINDFEKFVDVNIVGYIQNLISHPFELAMFILDIVIVVFCIMKMASLIKDTRVWQLIKGIIIILIATVISGILKLTIVNFILTQFMTGFVFALVVIFQPEIRRVLEELGTGSIRKIFKLEMKDKEIRTKEQIYKVAIAAQEMSNTKTGALIVFERDIRLNDIINTGIEINAEISPQLLCNIFVTRTPLHDGIAKLSSSESYRDISRNDSVIISNNKIAAASCMLPLSNDPSIPQELGTRHRAAIGISKESDAIVVVVSEETGKISIAKDGTLIADVKDETLKKILIKNLIVEPKENDDKKKKQLPKQVQD